MLADWATTLDVAVEGLVAAESKHKGASWKKWVDRATEKLASLAHRWCKKDGAPVIQLATIVGEQGFSLTSGFDVFCLVPSGLRGKPYGRPRANQCLSIG